jgi:serine/threonine protein kinase
VSKFEPNGDLFDLINMSANGLPVDIAKIIFREIVSGVKYLHSKNLAHRDLKLENCFLDENFRVKIGDFGLLTVLENGALETQCGTAAYMAPELVGDEDLKYEGKPVDIYALGVMLFMILTCKPLQIQPSDEYITCF